MSKKLNKEIIINKINQPKVKDFLYKNGIKHLYLVGSYASGEETQESDIDLIYESNPNYQLGLEFFGIITYLEELFNKKIDIVEDKFINNKIKEYVLFFKTKII